MAKHSVFNTYLFVSTGALASATAKPITSITNAKPPVVTSATHGLKSGDVIALAGTGSEELDTVYIVEKIDETSFMLANDDWSDRMAISSATGLTFTQQAISQFCDVTSMDIDPLKISYDDDVTLCSRSKTSKKEYGTIGVDANWLPKSQFQRMLQSFLESQEKHIVGMKPAKSDTIYAWRVMLSQFQRSGDADDKFEAGLEWQVDSTEAIVDLVP